MEYTGLHAADLLQRDVTNCRCSFSKALLQCLAQGECACLQAAGATSVFQTHVHLAPRSAATSMLPWVGQGHTQAHLVLQPPHERHTAAAAATTRGEDEHIRAARATGATSHVCQRAGFIRDAWHAMAHAALRRSSMQWHTEQYADQHHPPRSAGLDSPEPVFSTLSLSLKVNASCRSLKILEEALLYTLGVCFAR